MSVNSMYGFNPYMMQSTGLNNDFLANAAFSANQQAMFNQTYQQPTADTFQQQGSSSAPLTLGLIGGGATAAGMYQFGSAPVKDGKVASGLIEALNKAQAEQAKNAAYTKLYEAELAKKLPTGMNLEQYKAIEQLSRANSIDDLAAEVKAKLPADCQNPAAVQSKLNSIKIDEIDKTKLQQQAEKAANRNNLEYHNKHLSNAQSAKAKIDALPEGATKADIEKMIKSNPETFGIRNCTEAEINKRARLIADKFDTKAKYSALYEQKINAQTAKIETIREGLSNTIKGHWDEAAGKFKTGTPEAVTKACKNFKLKTAGKWGAIAAAGGVLLGWMFGGK